MPPGDDYFRRLRDRVEGQDAGYGIYLGQRQFRADIDYIDFYSAEDISFLEESDVLDSVCLQENVVDFSEEDGIHILLEQMPIHMKAEVPGKKPARKKYGREPVSVKRVLFEKNGKRIHGCFKNCWNVGNKTISFY